MPVIYSSPDVVGYMPMPVSFRYRSLFQQGRPRHERFDDFWRKHPPMDHVHRAKIFAPFDALAGFDDCIDSKRIQYEEKRILSETENEELNEKLTLLHALTCNGKATRKNKPQVTATCFVPCSDEHNDWFHRGGRYVSINGTVRNVNRNAIMIDDRVIALEDIAGIDIMDANTKKQYSDACICT